MNSCSALNLVAFAKIMKKYDKVVRHRVGSFYIKDVERSYFASSDVVQKYPLSIFYIIFFPK